MADKGWIKIHRKIVDSAIWTIEEPFDKRSAWIDLLISANREDNEIFVNGCSLVIHRGQKFTSITKLSEKWRWSRNAVARYLSMLESAKMIQRFGTHNGTLITIENYEKYQCVWYADEATFRYDDGTTGYQPIEREGSTNKKNKNIKKNKKKEEEAPPLLDPWGNVLE